MSPEARNLLSLRRLPAVLSVEEAGWFMGLQAHEVLILSRSGLLKPLGKPRRGPKRFATAALLPLAEDPTWLSRATDTIARHWREKNYVSPDEHHAG
jgi:hypothetical protein